MVLKINDDDEPSVASKPKFSTTTTGTSINGTNNIKPTTSAAAAAAANNYYTAGKIHRSSSSSSNSSSSCSESSSDFEHSYKSLSSRIGNEFQVDLDDYEVGKHNQNEIKLKETLVWKPTNELSDPELDNYINMSNLKYSYTIEQALALLCWDNYDLNEAKIHMKTYVPMPNEWTKEDEILFEQAYLFHGKNFSKIKQVLPDKTQASLVKFYYSWKKSRMFTSLIDSNQTTNKTSNGDSTNNNDLINDSIFKDDVDDFNAQKNDENDADDETNFINNVNKICCNCDLISSDLQSTPKGMLCEPCFKYWKYSNNIHNIEAGGLMRPDIKKNNQNGISTSTSAVSSRMKEEQRGNSIINSSREARNFQKSLRKPPKGIYLNYEELSSLVDSDIDQFDALSKRLGCLKKDIQLNKQLNANLISKLSDEIDSKVYIDEHILEIEKLSHESPCWTAHEIELVIQGFDTYGTDFLAISQVLSTKSENSVRAFYSYFKDHLNLDKLTMNNAAKIKAEANNMFNDLAKQNRSDLPVIVAASLVQTSAEIVQPKIEQSLDLPNKMKTNECITID